MRAEKVATKPPPLNKGPGTVICRRYYCKAIDFYGACPLLIGHRYLLGVDVKWLAREDAKRFSDASR